MAKLIFVPAPYVNDLSYVVHQTMSPYNVAVRGDLAIRNMWVELRPAEFLPQIKEALPILYDPIYQYMRWYIRSDGIRKVLGNAEIEHKCFHRVDLIDFLENCIGTILLQELEERETVNLIFEKREDCENFESWFANQIIYSITLNVSPLQHNEMMDWCKENLQDDYDTINLGLNYQKGFKFRFKNEVEFVMFKLRFE